MLRPWCRACFQLKQHCGCAEPACTVLPPECSACLGLMGWSWESLQEVLLAWYVGLRLAGAPSMVKTLKPRRHSKHSEHDPCARTGFCRGCSVCSPPFFRWVTWLVHRSRHAGWAVRLGSPRSHHLGYMHLLTCSIALVLNHAGPDTTLGQTHDGIKTRLLWVHLLGSRSGHAGQTSRHPSELCCLTSCSQDLPMFE